MEAQVLARRVGINPGSLSNLERGTMKTTPDPSVFRGISQELGIPVSQMLSVLGYLDGGAAESESEAVSAVRAILEGREFTEKQIGQLTRQIRGLVEMMEG